MNTKQVIIIRTDLNMPIGKISSQAGHAVQGIIMALASSITEDEIVLKINPVIFSWLFNQSSKKITVGVKSEEKLLQLQKKAQELGILNYLVTDAGHTVFNGVPTKTTLILGPDLEEKIDLITKKLQLLK